MTPGSGTKHGLDPLRSNRTYTDKDDNMEQDTFAWKTLSLKNPASSGSANDLSDTTLRLGMAHGYDRGTKEMMDSGCTTVPPPVG